MLPVVAANVNHGHMWPERDRKEALSIWHRVLNNHFSAADALILRSK